jgi:hypothetical protein
MDRDLLLALYRDMIRVRRFEMDESRANPYFDGADR